MYRRVLYILLVLFVGRTHGETNRPVLEVADPIAIEVVSSAPLTGVDLINPSPVRLDAVASANYAEVPVTEISAMDAAESIAFFGTEIEDVPETSLMTLDAVTLTTAQQINLVETDAVTLTSAEQIGLVETDAVTLTSAEQIGLVETDAVTLTSAEQIGLVETDAVTLATAEQIGLVETDAVSLTGAEQIGLVETDAVTLTSVDDMNLSLGNAVTHIPEASHISAPSIWRDPVFSTERVDDSEAWDAILRRHDQPNDFTPSALADTAQWKLIEIPAFRVDTNRYAEILDRAATGGYNGLVIGYRTNIGAEPVQEMISWATNHFDVILVSVVPQWPLPSPDKVSADLNAIFGSGNIDAAIVGFGKSIDLAAAYRPDHKELFRYETLIYINRWIDSQLFDLNVPIVGFKWFDVHNRNVDYSYIPDGAAGILAGNIQPSGTFTMILTDRGLENKLSILPPNKPVILGPFIRTAKGRNMTHKQLDRQVESYHIKGYGVMRRL